MHILKTVAYYHFSNECKTLKLWQGLTEKKGRGAVHSISFSLRPAPSTTSLMDYKSYKLTKRICLLVKFISFLKNISCY